MRMGSLVVSGEIARRGEIRSSRLPAATATVLGLQSDLLSAAFLGIIKRAMSHRRPSQRR